MSSRVRRDRARQRETVGGSVDRSPRRQRGGQRCVPAAVDCSTVVAARSARRRSRRSRVTRRRRATVDRAQSKASTRSSCPDRSSHVDRFELPFPTPPGSVSLDLKGWHVYGEQDGHLRGGAAAVRTRSRNASGRTAASLAPEPIAPYFRISRTFDFGLEWRIHTTLTRIAPESGSIPFAVPLVAGESLLDGGVRVGRRQAYRRVATRRNRDRLAERACEQSTHSQLKAPAVARLERAVDPGAIELLARRLRRHSSDAVPMKLAADEADGPALSSRSAVKY